MAENFEQTTVATDTVATVEHPAEAHAYVESSALGLTSSAWVALAMIGVIAILIWKKVPAVIGGALDKKIHQIRAQLDEAASLRAEAEAIKAEYEAKAAAAAQEAQAIVAQARSDADAIIAKATADSNALIERRGRIAEEKIAAAERGAIAEVRAKAAEVAAEAASRLIADNHGAANDRVLIDSAISGIGTSTRLN